MSAQKKKPDTFRIAETERLRLQGDEQGKLTLDVKLPSVKDVDDLQHRLDYQHIRRARGKTRHVPRDSMNALDMLAGEGLITEKDIDALGKRLSHIDRQASRLIKRNRPVDTTYLEGVQKGLSWLNQYRFDRDQPVYGQTLSDLNLTEDGWVRKNLASSVSVRLVDADLENLPPLSREFTRDHLKTTREGVRYWEIGTASKMLTQQAMATAGEILQRPRLTREDNRKIRGSKTAFLRHLHGMRRLLDDPHASFLDLDADRFKHNLKSDVGKKGKRRYFLETSREKPFFKKQDDDFVKAVFDDMLQSAHTTWTDRENFDLIRDKFRFIGRAMATATASQAAKWPTITPDLIKHLAAKDFHQKLTTAKPSDIEPSRKGMEPSDQLLAYDHMVTAIHAGIPRQEDRNTAFDTLMQQMKKSFPKNGAWSMTAVMTKLTPTLIAASKDPKDRFDATAFQEMTQTALAIGTSGDTSQLHFYMLGIQLPPVLSSVSDFPLPQRPPALARLWKLGQHIAPEQRIHFMGRVNERLLAPIKRQGYADPSEALEVIDEETTRIRGYASKDVPIKRKDPTGIKQLLSQDFLENIAPHIIDAGQGDPKRLERLARATVDHAYNDVGDVETSLAITEKIVPKLLSETEGEPARYQKALHDAVKKPRG